MCFAPQEPAASHASIPEQTTCEAEVAGQQDWNIRAELQYQLRTKEEGTSPFRPDRMDNGYLMHGLCKEETLHSRAIFQALELKQPLQIHDHDDYQARDEA